jgi:hypothetical protein
MSGATDPDRLLAIYLNDHLAGSVLGVELARRLRASNSEDDALGRPLAVICAEVEADRETLQRLMRQLNVRRDPLKPAAAWLAEKLGRLKLNGRLTGYSPLSRLVELEMLSIGIAGKMQLWEVLERTLGEGIAGFDFQQLAERAAGQRERVRELHSIAAARALPPRGQPAGS